VPQEWLTIYPTIADIDSKKTSEFLLVIKVPTSAQEGVYTLKVKATDSVESNEKEVSLIIGKNQESLIKLLIGEIEKWRRMAEEALKLKCMDINELITIFGEGEIVRGLGLRDIDSGNLKNAQELLIQAINDYENVVTKADILMELRLQNTKPLISFPLTKRIKLGLEGMERAMRERNYTEFCVDSSTVQMNSTFSILILVSSVLLFICLGFLILILLKKKREKTTAEKMEEIRRRLRRTIKTEMGQ
jgi:hypothetical protein